MLNKIAMSETIRLTLRISSVSASLLVHVSTQQEHNINNKEEWIETWAVSIDIKKFGY